AACAREAPAGPPCPVDDQTVRGPAPREGLMNALVVTGPAGDGQWAARDVTAGAHRTNPRVVDTPPVARVTDRGRRDCGVRIQECAQVARALAGPGAPPIGGSRG